MARNSGRRVPPSPEVASQQVRDEVEAKGSFTRGADDADNPFPGWDVTIDPNNESNK